MKKALLFVVVVIAIGHIEAVCQDDPTADCANKKNLCNVWQYDDLMNKMCPKTCNRCTKPTCADKDYRCAAWEKNSQFCESTGYTDAQKEEVCAKTCGFCT